MTPHIWLQDLQWHGRIKTPVKNRQCHSKDGWLRETTGGIVQLPYHSRIAFHLWMSMWVQLGFRTRPLRDGGGKPSPGRLVPPIRKQTGITSMGQKIIDITPELNQAVQMSICCGEKNHPFSDELLNRIRQCIGATAEDGVAEGQPFFLTLISRLAKMCGDPDWEYPLTLQEGVPLGVGEPTLTPREFGQQKRNSKVFQKNGKIYLHLLAVTTTTQQRPSRTLSKRHSWRRKRWAWWKAHSPNRKRETGAGVFLVNYGPGPMAAIDEGDKIRTIYDGSFGGANAHIQKNSTEKTTAPAGMDCVHGIHWLRAAGEAADGGAATPGHGATAGAPHVKRECVALAEEGLYLSTSESRCFKGPQRIKILKPGWKYQVAQIDQQWWVNKVGTYGVASAQLYWGRLAALLLRILCMPCSRKWTGDLSL